jgi:hypothetical protein
VFLLSMPYYCLLTYGLGPSNLRSFPYSSD